MIIIISIISMSFYPTYTPQVAGLVTAEFFEQGDVEKEDLNIQPIVRTLQSSFCVLILFSGFCVVCCRL